MNLKPISVLLVEDDPSDAKLIQDALAGEGRHAFRVEWVMRLADALKRIAEGAVEVVLLDLTLPDALGIDAFDRILAATPQSLILVLSGANDEEVARQAVQRGAQDYLAKGHVDAHWLPRALSYVIERNVTREALRDSEERFRMISDASPLGIFVADAEGRCIYTNAEYHRISGLDFQATLGSNWTTAIHPEDRSRVLAEWRAAAMGQEPFQTEYRFLRSGDNVVWTRVSSAPLPDGQRRQGRIKTVEDITERKTDEFILRAAEEALFAEKERAQVTLNSIGDAVLTTDIAGRVMYMNLVAEKITGWNVGDAQGLPVSQVLRLLDGVTRDTAADPARRAIDENRTVGLSAGCVLVRRDGQEHPIEDSASPIHNREGDVIGAVIVFHDVSESRAMALKMSHLAQHDFLTGLPNRVLLTERLSRAIGLARRHNKQVGVLFLDLDYFKHVNDSLGHAIGDQLLQSVASRLSANVRATDTVCRQGGDEFVILLAEIEKRGDAALIAEKMLAVFTVPHLIGRHELHVTLSIGVSIYPDDGVSEDAVMQDADTAMYHAKAKGRNNYQFFRPDMNARAVHRLELENSLRRALKAQEFVLHYQPKIEISSGALTGVESLIRWQDPSLGMVPPGHFVPIAEECGLIVPIGRWVLGEACRQVRSWLDAGLPAVPVAVNISAVEFRSKDFVKGVAAILDETGLAPQYLELELTESILMCDAESSTGVLEALKAMGVLLAIDDFGTGYSSLSYLKRFPIDTLKIDQSFVRDLSTNPDNATIVSAVIGMGRNLRQRVVAEGVETQEQLAFLQRERCDQGQGFLFSRPVVAEELGRMLREGIGALPS